MAQPVHIPETRGEVGDIFLDLATKIPTETVPDMVSVLQWIVCLETALDRLDGWATFARVRTEREEATR